MPSPSIVPDATEPLGFPVTSPLPRFSVWSQALPAVCLGPNPNGASASGKRNPPVTITADRAALQACRLHRRHDQCLNAGRLSLSGTHRPP